MGCEVAAVSVARWVDVGEVVDTVWDGRASCTAWTAARLAATAAGTPEFVRLSALGAGAELPAGLVNESSRASPTPDWFGESGRTLLTRQVPPVQVVPRLRVGMGSLFEQAGSGVVPEVFDACAVTVAPATDAPPLAATTSTGVRGMLTVWLFSEPVSLTFTGYPSVE